MKPFTPYGRKDLRDIATRLEQERSGRSSTRVLGPDHVYTGLVGEYEFSRIYKVGMDLEFRPEGDGGVDFTLPMRTKAGVLRPTTIDVKTLRCDKWLLIEASKLRADIYVFAHYNADMDAVRLLGWQCSKLVKGRYPPQAFPRDIVNHVIPRGELRYMDEFSTLIAQPNAITA